MLECSYFCKIFNYKSVKNNFDLYLKTNKMYSILNSCSLFLEWDEIVLIRRIASRVRVQWFSKSSGDKKYIFLASDCASGSKDPTNHFRLASSATASWMIAQVISHC